VQVQSVQDARFDLLSLFRGFREVEERCGRIDKGAEELLALLVA
jgi:hypothetical protein